MAAEGDTRKRKRRGKGRSRNKTQKIANDSLSEISSLNKDRNHDNGSTSSSSKSSNFLDKMKARLSGGHFRMLNEKLYTCTYARGRCCSLWVEKYMFGFARGQERK